MKDYQHDFIRFALESDVLRFGTFILKSGRESPYFFNSGLFDSGRKLAELGRFYAQAIASAELEFDFLFGPAYKGIPLVAATSIAMWELFERDVPYAFNRKEAKDHGEGGELVGAQIAGRGLIVDDVISAGTSVRESVRLISDVGASPVAVAIALDRQERGAATRSAVDEVAETFDLDVVSVISLTDMVEYLSRADQAGNKAHLAAIRTYRENYGKR